MPSLGPRGLFISWGPSQVRTAIIFGAVSASPSAERHSLHHMHHSVQYVIDLVFLLVYTVNMPTQRDQILSAACDLLVTGGLNGLSMRKLASQLGVTAPALYRHYESKETVLVDVVGEAFKVFAQYLYRAVEGRTPVERFTLMRQSFLAFALEHRQYYALLHAAGEIMGRDGLPHDATDHASGVGQFMVDRVREGMECGMLKPGPPEIVAWTIWAHWHGLVSIYHRGFFRIDEAEFRRLFRESSWRLMEGLAEPEFAEEMGESVRASIEAAGRSQAAEPEAKEPAAKAKG